MADPALGIGAFFMADYHHRAAAKTGEPSLDRLIVAEGAVAGERRKVFEQTLDVVAEMGPLGVSCDLGLLPGRQLGIGLTEKLVGTLLEPRDLIGEIKIAAMGKVMEFLDLAL